jgi:hypothetical protein
MIHVAESEEKKETILAKLNTLDWKESNTWNMQRRNVARLIGTHSLLPRGIIVDSSVPGILLSPPVACQEDLVPGQFKADCPEMPD